LEFGGFSPLKIVWDLVFGIWDFRVSGISASAVCVLVTPWPVRVFNRHVAASDHFYLGR
jgi:hypothetical protein